MVDRKKAITNSITTSISDIKRTISPIAFQESSDKYVDVHFEGMVSSSITGEITNLEEDMIEITTYGEKKTLYIDFAYNENRMYLKVLLFRNKSYISLQEMLY